MRISDWSSDVCSSDLAVRPHVLAYRRLVWLRTTSWACAWAARNDLAAALASTVPATAGPARRLARFVHRTLMAEAPAPWGGTGASYGRPTTRAIGTEVRRQVDAGGYLHSGKQT